MKLLLHAILLVRQHEITVASPKHDELQADALVFRTWQHYGPIRCRANSEPEPESESDADGTTSQSQSQSQSQSTSLQQRRLEEEGEYYDQENNSNLTNVTDAFIVTTISTSTSTTTTSTANVFDTLGNLSAFCDLEVETCTQIQTKDWKPLRLGFKVLDVEGVPIHDVQSGQDLQRSDFVSGVLIPRAAAYLQQALQLRRTTSLRADYVETYCEQRSTKEEGYTCAASKAPVCGNDRVPIPPAYLNGRKVCYNCTDVVDVATSDGVDACEYCEKEVDGSDADGYDFFLFITIRDTPSCSTFGTKAYGTTCVRDQCDRPVFGILNLCRSSLSIDAASTNEQVSHTLHELIHILVFSSSHFRFFRNADGTPKLPRYPNDESKIIGEIPWSCASSRSWTYPDVGGSRVHVDLVSSGLVGLYDERGIDSCPCPVGGNTVNRTTSTMGDGCLIPRIGMRMPACVLKLQTPKVINATRHHFGCQYLQGAELENQEAGCVIFGSHWEQRIFMSELMASVFPSPATDVYISEVTLALFEDSGWYMPDYSLADVRIKGVNWGYRQGCEFALNSCITEGKSTYPSHWCMSKVGRACSLDRMRDVECDFSPYFALSPAVTYFGSMFAGSLPVADYCPMHLTTISNHICVDATSVPAPYSYANAMRELFGPSSRCLDSTLHADVGAAGGGIYVANPQDFIDPRPGCFEVKCSGDGSSYEVHVANLQAVPVTKMSLGFCSKGGQAIGTPSLNGKVFCAPPEEICLPMHLSHSYSHRKHNMRWNTTTTTTTSTTISTTDPNATSTTDPNATTVITTTTNTTSTTSSTSTTITTTTVTTTTTSNSTTATSTDPNATFTTVTSTTSTSTTTTLPPPSTTSRKSTTSSSTPPTTITTTTTTSTTTTTTSSTTTTTTATTTPAILSVEGSMAIGVYDLFDIDRFLADMGQFDVMKITIAETVGAATDLVEILQMHVARRLRNASALVGTPTQRLLQAVSHFIVSFRISTQGQGTLAGRTLNTLATVSMYAMTFQLQKVMERLSLPRSYSIVIFNVTAEPVVQPSASSPSSAPNVPDTQRTSSGCKSLSSHDVYAILWLYVAIGAYRSACCTW